MKTIGVVSVGRSDYGIYLPLLKLLQNHPLLTLKLYVSGMHLSEEFGSTVQQIEKDGYDIIARIPSIQASDSAEGVALAIGIGVEGFSRAFSTFRPDLLVVLGDRFDMFAAAVAAIPFNIPILHLHGGELTEGAMDDRLRHSLTKLSHLHGVSTETYRRRVIQMGEESWRVLTCGALALDNLKGFKALNRHELEHCFGLDLGKPPLLVTLHPTTNEKGSAGTQTDILLKVLERCGENQVFTLPNADMQGRLIRSKIEMYCKKNPQARIVENFGPEGYFSMLSHASAMIGNSSSGILEAPSFRLPVVNIGSRQEGRLKASNVLDVPFDPGEISKALAKALSPAFRTSLEQLVNPYGDGHASERLIEWICALELDERLLHKKFRDLQWT